METNTTTNPTNEAPTTGVQASGLPSDVQEQEAIGSQLDFSLTDAVKEKFITKDGKLLGKYDNLEQLAEAHKFLQDKHAMYVDDTKKAERDVAAELEKQQATVKQQETINSLIPEFMANNMQLTPEMEQKLTDTGLDIRDVKLGALELEKKVNHVHSLVGGKENWEAAKQYLSTVISPEQLEAINQDLMGSNSDFTVMGMYNAYQQSLKDGTPQQRISGDSQVPKSASGYESKAQLYADREYLSTPAGRNDANAQKRYRQRLANTDLSSLGIRS